MFVSVLFVSTKTFSHSIMTHSTIVLLEIDYLHRGTFVAREVEISISLVYKILAIKLRTNYFMAHIYPLGANAWDDTSFEIWAPKIRALMHWRFSNFRASPYEKKFFTQVSGTRRHLYRKFDNTYLKTGTSFNIGSKGIIPSELDGLDMCADICAKLFSNSFWLKF